MQWEEVKVAVLLRCAAVVATPRSCCQAKNAPTPRSGHRMIAFKNMLLVFGGFFDNGSSVRNFNDLSAPAMPTQPRQGPTGMCSTSTP
jgi:hypothetical protein